MESVPELLSLSIVDGSVASDSFVVSANISSSPLGGVIYCGAFESSTSDLSFDSLESIREQGFFTAISASSMPSVQTVPIEVNMLRALTMYDVHCYIEDSEGNTGTFSNSFDRGVMVSTTCCRDVFFSQPVPAYAFSALESYDVLSGAELSQSSVTIQLSDVPDSSLSVSLVFSSVDDNSVVNDVFTSPSSLTFRSASSVLDGQFLVFGAPGSYTVTIQLSGDSVDEFEASSVIQLAVVELLPPPQLQSAAFGVNGARVSIIFDSNTDLADTVLADAGVWPCDSVFSFNGADTAGCYWDDARTVVSILNFFGVTANPLRLSDNIVLLDSVVRAECVQIVCNEEFAASSSVEVGVVAGHVVPSAVLRAPTTITPCDSLRLDPSLSTGHGGRDWEVIEWTVTEASGSDTSAILEFLNTQTGTTSPIFIPADLLETTSYTISLGLLNFLQDASTQIVFNSVTVTVSAAGSEFSVAVDTAASFSLDRSRRLRINSEATLTTCDGDVVSQSDASVTFAWSVEQLMNNANYASVGISSASRSQSVFLASAYTFEARQTYRITVLATAMFEGSAFTSSRSVVVSITRGNLVAVINSGESEITVNVGESFVLDGSTSRDPSVNTANGETKSLIYSWSCLVLSAENFGDNCLDGFSGDLSASSIEIPSQSLMGNVSYEYTLVVSSNLGGVSRTDSTSLIVIGSADGAMLEIDFDFSTVSGQSQTIAIPALITGDEDVTLVWSLRTTGTGLVLMDAAITPLMLSLTASQVSMGFPFDLGLSQAALADSVSYTFRLTATTASGGVSYADVFFAGFSAPSGGGFQVVPSTGDAYETMFLFSASGWVDDPADYPLFYQFRYQFGSTRDPTGIEWKANLQSTESYATSILPEGDIFDNNAILCIVQILDSVGASAEAEFPITVFDNFRRLEAVDSVSQRRLISDERALELLDIYIGRADRALIANSPQRLLGALQTSTNILLALEVPDCDAAPDCAAFNREQCSSVPHTCGECRQNFTGMAGPQNYPCSEESLGDVGDDCQDNSDCSTGFCFLPIGNGAAVSRCAYPTKLCPLGLGGNECSGQGQCDYINYAGGEISVENCTVDNTYCTPMCSCDPGFGGDDCSQTIESVQERSSIRATLCTQVSSYADLLDPSELKIQLLVDFVSVYFKQDELINIENITACGDALSLLAEEIAITGTDFQSVYIEQEIVNTISEFVSSPLYENISSSIADTADNFRRSVHDRMISGQIDVEFTSPNLRVGFFYPIRDNLASAIVSAPRTTEEELYDTAQSSVQFPSDGLTGCQFVGVYARVTAAAWGFNPYVRNESIAATVFSVVTYATEIEEQDDDAGDSNYNVVLQFLGAQNWGETEPVCQEINTATSVVSDCDTCFISSFSAFSADMVCDDAQDYFCPDADNRDSDRRLASKFVPRQLQAGDDVGQTLYTATSVSVDAPRSFSTSTPVQNNVPALSFICALLFIFLLLVFVFHTWDLRDRNAFIYARSEEVKYPYKFNLSAAFDERGKGLDLQTLAPAPSGDDLDNDEDDDVVREDSIGSSDAQRFPPSSFLSQPTLSERFLAAIYRHHRWIRMFTYPSIPRTRVIRFLVMASDLLILIFADTVFYRAFYPDDNECEKHNGSSEEECVSDNSRFDVSEDLCEWDSSNGECTLKEPSLNAVFILQVTLLIIIFSAVPRRIVQLLLEKVCAKRPVLSDESWLRAEPAELKDKSRKQPAVDSSSSALVKADESDSHEEPKGVLGEDEFQVVIKEDTFRESEAPVSEKQPQEPTESGMAPYRLAYTDQFNAGEELNILVTSTKEFFNSTLESVAFPWRGNEEEANAAAGGRQLALMGAIMTWMGVYADGTPVPLTIPQRILFGNPTQHMIHKLNAVRRHARWIHSEAVTDYNLKGGQLDYMNIVLIQHFLLEQLSPVTRFALERNLFQMDHGAQGRVNVFGWVASWALLIGFWAFMSFWIIDYAANHGTSVSSHWGLVLAIVVLIEIFLNEVSQVVFLSVLVMDKLRGQIRQTYNVLKNVYHKRVRRQDAPGLDIRLVQHISGACRASRFNALSHLRSAAILSYLDDNDIDLCRMRRVSSIWAIGPVSYIILFLPSLCNNFYDVVQQATLDLLIPIFWCCFFLLNWAINYASTALLIVLWILAALLAIFFYYIRHTEWYARYTATSEGIGEDVVVADGSRLHPGVAPGVSMNLRDIGWRDMNTPHEIYGANFEVIDFNPEFANEPFSESDFTGFGGTGNSANTRAANTAPRQNPTTEADDEVVVEHVMIENGNEEAVLGADDDDDVHLRESIAEITEEIRDSELFQKQAKLGEGEVTVKDEPGDQL